MSPHFIHEVMAVNKDKLKGGKKKLLNSTAEIGQIYLQGKCLCSYLHECVGIRDPSCVVSI